MKCTWRREFKRARELRKTFSKEISIKKFDNMVSAEIAKSCLVDPSKFHPKYPHKRSKEYVGIKARYIPKAKYYLYDRSIISYIVDTGNIAECIEKGLIAKSDNIPYRGMQYIDSYHIKAKYEAVLFASRTNMISENKEENYI